MSDSIPQPPPTKKNISAASKDSGTRKIELSPHRITQDIRIKLDQAKFEDTWLCELPQKEFEFMVGKNHAMPFFYFENVKVVLEGKLDEVAALESRTAEDAVADEQEISRQRREAEEKTAGRLQRPAQHESNYHPRVKPE